MILVHVRRSLTRFPVKRAQRWYWVAKAVNGKTLAKSEMYTNRGDCIHNAQLLFGGNNNIAINVGAPRG